MPTLEERRIREDVIISHKVDVSFRRQLEVQLGYRSFVVHLLPFRGVEAVVDLYFR